ncbi:MAG: Arc family DNA-binding protein [Thermoplasmata archaeon]
MPAMKSVRPERFTTTLPRDLLKKVRDRAESEGRPINYYFEKGLRVVVLGEEP